MKRGGDVGADAVGVGFKVGLHFVNNEVLVKGEAQRHVVDVFPGLYVAAEIIGKIIGFRVGDAAFDVKKTVAAAVSVALDVAEVKGRAWCWGGQGHGDVKTL